MGGGVRSPVRRCWNLPDTNGSNDVVVAPGPAVISGLQCATGYCVVAFEDGHVDSFSLNAVGDRVRDREIPGLRSRHWRHVVAGKFAVCGLDGSGGLECLSVMTGSAL